MWMFVCFHMSKGRFLAGRRWMTVGPRDADFYFLWTWLINETGSS